MSAADPRLPQYPVQLVGARLYSAQLARRGPIETDPEGPGLDFGVRAHSVREDLRGLSVLVGATVTVRLNSEIVASIECAIDGTFNSDVLLTDDFVTEFINGGAKVILWPYLRAAVGEVARMAEVDAPPLPTLDVLNVLEAARESQPRLPTAPAARRAAKPRAPRASRS
jgi:preprotein translocase subunit SecB